MKLREVTKQDKEKIMEMYEEYMLSELIPGIDRFEGIRDFEKIRELSFEEWVENLDKNSNRVLLSNNEFSKFKKLYENMRNKDDLRKKVVIETVAHILAYLYYQAKYIEDNQETLMDELFEYEIPNIYNYKEYKNEIFRRTNEILKKEYL